MPARLISQLSAISSLVVGDKIPVETSGNVTKYSTIQKIFDLLATVSDLVLSYLKVGSSGTRMTEIRKYTPTIDVTSVSGTSYSTQAYTVTGLAVGDVVVVNPGSTYLSAGLIMSCWYVSAADTLTVAHYNRQAGAINPGSETWTIFAFRAG